MLYLVKSENTQERKNVGIVQLHNIRKTVESVAINGTPFQPEKNSVVCCLEDEQGGLHLKEKVKSFFKFFMLVEEEEDDEPDVVSFRIEKILRRIRY